MIPTSKQKRTGITKLRLQTLCLVCVLAQTMVLTIEQTISSPI
jgi:hypothetical protein